MSEERTPDAIWRFKFAGENGKKLLRIELFRAKQWRRSWRPHKRNMQPKPPIHAGAQEYWDEYYRLRIDGRWYGKNGNKFHFFTMQEAVTLAGEITQKGGGATGRLSKKSAVKQKKGLPGGISVALN